MILYAVNYSDAANALRRRGEIHFDLFKCPAWPKMIRRVQAQYPVYVHFPLRAGAGAGEPVNTETGMAPDWARLEAILDESETRWVSVHLGPKPADHPDIPPTSTEPADLIEIGDALIRDLESVVARFGPDRVVAENIFEYYGMHLRAAVLPKVITRVVEATGCGLLLDLSHARLAARDLSVDPWRYMDALPVHRLREVHVTGIQTVAGRWIERFEAEHVSPARIAELSGREIDHFPMTKRDWPMLAQALDRIDSGIWACPGIIAYEYGGVGPFFEALTREPLLSAQVPRMRRMVRAIRERECLPIGT